MDYAGGLRKHGSGYAGSFRDRCRPYDGPRLVLFVAACKAPDGSYWALQRWQRIAPMRGFDPFLPEQRAHELHVSHWSGPAARARRLAELDLRRPACRGCSAGSPTAASPCTASGHRLRRGTIPYARFVYIDTFNSVYGPGWKRDTGIVTHLRNGAFCYSFVAQVPPPGYPSKEPRGPGNGERHRVTVMGPGVTPIVRWEGEGLGRYNAVADQAFNRLFDQWVGPDDKVCARSAELTGHVERGQPLRLLADHVDPVDPRAARALAHEGDDRLDGVPLAFEDRLDGPVGLVRTQPVTPRGLRAPAGRLAEEDALDVTSDRDAPANHPSVVSRAVKTARRDASGFVDRAGVRRAGRPARDAPLGRPVPPAPVAQRWVAFRCGRVPALA